MYSNVVRAIGPSPEYCDWAKLRSQFETLGRPRKGVFSFLHVLHKRECHVLFTGLIHTDPKYLDPKCSSNQTGCTGLQRLQQGLNGLCSG